MKCTTGLQAFQVVQYDPSTGAQVDTTAETPPSLGQGKLIDHVADYTFMQGRRPTQEVTTRFYYF